MMQSISLEKAIHAGVIKYPAPVKVHTDTTIYIGLDLPVHNNPSLGYCGVTYSDVGEIAVLYIDTINITIDDCWTNLQDILKNLIEKCKTNHPNHKIEVCVNSTNNDALSQLCVDVMDTHTTKIWWNKNTLICCEAFVCDVVFDPTTTHYNTLTLLLEQFKQCAAYTPSDSSLSGAYIIAINSLQES
jgi:hypothetical protein